MILIFVLYKGQYKYDIIGPNTCMHLMNYKQNWISQKEKGCILHVFAQIIILTYPHVIKIFQRFYFSRSMYIGVVAVF